MRALASAGTASNANSANAPAANAASRHAVCPICRLIAPAPSPLPVAAFARQSLPLLCPGEVNLGFTIWQIRDTPVSRLGWNSADAAQSNRHAGCDTVRHARLHHLPGKFAGPGKVRRLPQGGHADAGAIFGKVPGAGWADRLVIERRVALRADGDPRISVVGPDAEGWYNSPAYQEILLRFASAA